MTSILRYATGEDIRLGDKIRVRRFLRSPLVATVCYLPGVSPKHPDIEYEDVRQWAYRAAKGTVYVVLYAPETFQPPRKFEFISRGSEVGISPTERLV